MFSFNNNNLSNNRSIRPNFNQESLHGAIVNKRVNFTNINTINLEKNAVELSLNIVGLDHILFENMSKQNFLDYYDEKSNYINNVNVTLSLNILLKYKLTYQDIKILYNDEKTSNSSINNSINNNINNKQILFYNDYKPSQNINNIHTNMNNIHTNINNTRILPREIIPYEYDIHNIIENYTKLKNSGNYNIDVSYNRNII